MLLSVVVPCFNEQNGIDEFFRRTTKACEMIGLDLEFVFVNDGSTDATLEQIMMLKSISCRIKIVDLSRNFGKEVALTAGLDHAAGDIVIPIDADLQDPPEIIPLMVSKWRDGYNVVYARRNSREGDSFLKRNTATLFYRLMRYVGGRVKIPENVGDFRLIDRKALDALLTFRERHRFMKGLFALVGFRQASIDYSRERRFADDTKWNYWKLWNLSLEGITSFTTAPLRISTYLGLMVAFLAFVYGAFIVLKAVLFGDPVGGFPSIIAIVTLLGGVQLVVLGIIGEYLARIFNETKERPLYFVQDIYDKQAAAEIYLIFRPTKQDAPSSTPTAG